LKRKKKFERIYGRERAKVESARDKKTEEELEEAIHNLQTQLFDITVDNQQTRLFMERVCMHQQLKKLRGNGNDVESLLKERDSLVKDVLQLQEKCAVTKRELVQLQKKCADLNEENRRFFAETKLNLPEAKSSEKLRFSPVNACSDWQKQVFSTLVIESKINFAKDPTLAKMFLM